MIVRLFCPRCAYGAIKNDMSVTVIDVPVPMARLSDDGTYQLKGDAGHVFAVCLSSIKVEVLFEMGVNSLLDGSRREAVSSFIASLERFYEFFLRAVMAHCSVPFLVVDEAWKPMSNASQTQIGAYVAAYLVLTKAPPHQLANAEINLRNRVVHKGYIPKDKEAVAFGDAVLTLIRRDIAILRTLAPAAMVATYETMSPQSKLPPDDPTDTKHLQGIVNCITTIDLRKEPEDEPRRRSIVVMQ